jgi:hypothetical protein
MSAVPRRMQIIAFPARVSLCLVPQLFFVSEPQPRKNMKSKKAKKPAKKTASKKTAKKR